MVESFKEIYEKYLFNRYMPTITCPKCNGEDIVIELDDGFFKIALCRKCKLKG